MIEVWKLWLAFAGEHWFISTVWVVFVCWAMAWMRPILLVKAHREHDDHSRWSAPTSGSLSKASRSSSLSEASSKASGSSIATDSSLAPSGGSRSGPPGAAFTSGARSGAVPMPPPGTRS